MTPPRTLQVSAAAFVLAVVALLVAGAYAMGIIGTGQKLAPTDRSSQTGSLRAEGNLHVDRNATVSGSLDVTGPTTVNDLVANGASRLSSLHGTGAAQFESTLTATQGIFTVGSGRPPLVVGSSTLVPNLHASNSELLAGQPGPFFIDVSGAPQSKAGAFAVGSLASGGLVVNGAGSIGGPFSVGGPLTVGGLTSLNGNLQVPGTSTLGALNTSGNATIGGTASVGGNTSVGGNLTVIGSTTIAQLNVQNLTVANNGTFGGALTVGGPTALNNSLTVAGPTTLQSGLGVAGNATVSGNLGVGGTITANTVNASTGSITTFNATTGNINTVNGSTGNLTTLNSTTGNIATVNGITINGVTGNLTTVVSTTGNITNVNSATVNATTANIGTVNGTTANFTGRTTLGVAPGCPGGAPRTLSVCGNAIVSGNLSTGSLTNGGPFTANGIINANGGISTTNGDPLNLTSADATVAVTGLLTTSNGATVNGGLLTANLGATVNGAVLTANDGLTVNGGPLTANGGITDNGAISVQGIANNGPLSSSGGAITLQGAPGNSVTIDGSGTRVTGPFSANDVTLGGTTNTTNLNNSGTLTSSSGDVSLTGSGGNAIAINAGGSTITGLLTANGGVNVNGAPLNATAGATVSGGALTANQGLSSSGGAVSLTDAGNSLTVDSTGTTVIGAANLKGNTTVGTGCTTGAQLTICGDTNTSGQLTAGGVSHLEGGITAASGTVTVTGNLTTGASNGTLTGYQLVSTIPSTCPLLGLCALPITPPLVVASHDQVTNLNANFLQGHPASDFTLGGAFAPATGSDSYIQNCSAAGNSCVQAANLNLTNTMLAPNTVTAVLTSSQVGVDALQVNGSSNFTGSTTYDGVTIFNTSLATFNAGFTVASGVATFNSGLTVAAGPANFKAGITVATGANTLLATGANDITLGTIGTPLTALRVNATTTTVNGDAAFRGTVKITKDLIGGNFAGTCAWAAPPTNQITCVTAVVGAPKEVIVTPAFNGGAFYVDTLGTTGPNASFVVHFPTGVLVLGNAVYYVVVR